MIKLVSRVKYAAASVYVNLTTNVIQVLICYLGGFFCLIPIYLQPISNLEDSLLRDSLTSVGFRYSSVATLALVIPVFFDTLTDLVFNHYQRGKQNTGNSVVSEGFLNTLEKVLFLSGIVVLPITAFFPESTTNWAFIYVCCNKCQLTFVGGAVIISLSRYNNKCWTNKATYLAVIMLSLGNSLASNIDNPKEVGQKVDYYVAVISYVIPALASFIFLSSAFRWYIGPLRRKLCAISNDPSLFEEKTCFFFPLVYITMSVMCILTIGVLSGAYNTLRIYDGTALLVNNLIYFAYVLFIIFISMRMSKLEVVQGLVS